MPSCRRFADEQPSAATSASASPSDSPGNPRRRFLVSPESLARAAENGLSPALSAHWYVKRTGAETPPAVRLLLLAASGRPAPLTARRPLILHAPSAQWLDGLLQHPATCDHLGERLGPTTAVIPDESLEAFRHALTGLGLFLEVEPRRVVPAHRDVAFRSAVDQIRCRVDSSRVFSMSGPGPAMSEPRTESSRSEALIEAMDRPLLDPGRPHHGPLPLRPEGADGLEPDGLPRGDAPHRPPLRLRPRSEAAHVTAATTSGPPGS